jgi:hypothetical protein
MHPNWLGQRVYPNHRGSRMHTNYQGSKVHPNGQGSWMHPNSWGSRMWPDQGRMVCSGFALAVCAMPLLLVRLKTTPATMTSILRIPHELFILWLYLKIELISLFQIYYPLKKIRISFFPKGILDLDNKDACS